MAFPLDGFQFIFCCLTVKTIYTKWRSIFTDKSDALSRAVLKRNSKLTWVYSVLSEALPYKLWFTRKKERPKYIWPAHLDLLNSWTSLTSCLVRFNQLLQYCCFRYQISNIANIIQPCIFPLRQKKIYGVENTFFSFHLRCCKNQNLWGLPPYPVTTTII